MISAVVAMFSLTDKEVAAQWSVKRSTNCSAFHGRICGWCNCTDSDLSYGSQLSR